MILLVQDIVALQASVTSVFNYVTNMDNYIKWFPGVIEIQSSNNFDHGTVGKQYIEILQLPDGRKELTIEVKESIQNKKFTTEGDLEPLLPMMSMSFFDQGNDGCQLHLSYFSRSPKMKHNDKLIVDLKNDLAVRLETASNNLKRILEE